jgi:hypothetical protein
MRFRERETMKLSQEKVARLSNVEWLSLRWQALQSEVATSVQYFNLLGQTWTGQVLQTATVAS